MAKQDKIHQLCQILDARRRPISTVDLAERLECSERTVIRYLDELRDTYHAPIISNGKGWFYDKLKKESWQMPGVWLTTKEIQSLLVLLFLLERFGDGLMREEFQAIRNNINKLIKRYDASDAHSLQQRIRITPVGNRRLADNDLSHVVNALVARRRIRFDYETYKREKTRRLVSPQRLAYYRDNWYLHGWCHRQKALRNFSVARMMRTRIDEDPSKAKEVDMENLDAFYESSYGAFTGKPSETARLRFLQPMASEIARQQWHKNQKGGWEGEDYLLSVPYSRSTELLQDIQRYLPHVVVEGPPALRRELRATLAKALDMCGNSV